jgi:hypothetical protein
LFLNQWSQARGRMEAEIQRKKEQINFATNFEKARGFVRTNWKTYGYNINEDPTQADSSEEDYGSEGESEELKDEVPEIEEHSAKERGSDDGSDIDSASEQELNDMPLINKDDAKLVQRIIRQKQPNVIDINSVSDKRATMMSTDEQIEMLRAIEEYRLALPERRFLVKKNHLPEITASNVSVQGRFWMDQNKKKASRMKYHYQPVGLVDGTVRTSLSSDDKFSIENKVRFI